jgi:NADH:ubiquinone oxidoreductase subunit 6 (subunit J)
MYAFLFWVIALLTGLCAIAVVVSQNIVRSATWLLFTLCGTAGIFFLLGADFVGATQLLVYVGGTLVLVVFGVMLTAQGPFITMRIGAAEWAISGLVGLLLFGVLAVSAINAGRPVLPPTVQAYAPNRPLSDDPAESQYTAVFGQGFSGVGVGPAHREQPSAGAEPRTVRASYLLPFEIVSVHLLVVLIGAAYLARAKRRREAAP